MTTRRDPDVVALENKLARIFGCGLVLLIITSFSALMAWLFMLVWNAVLPAIWPAAPKLNFWLSWGLCWLVGMLGRLLRGK